MRIFLKRKDGKWDEVDSFTQKNMNKAKDGIGANTTNGMADTDAMHPADLFLVDMEGDGDLDLFLSGTGGVDQFLVFRNKLK